jgi:hypothetical protein
LGHRQRDFRRRYRRESSALRKFQQSRVAIKKELSVSCSAPFQVFIPS